MTASPPRRVAVVGSGVAGLVAAHVASRTSDVTLLEADDRLGGHADTHRVVERTPAGREREVAIDTGFIVHNRRTYPVLLRLFAELGVATQDSEMSMSISDEETGVEWAGALGRRGVFPTWRHAVDPRHLKMLTDIPRFHRRARALLDRQAGRTGSGGHGDDQTLGAFLDEGRFDPYFRRHFMEPLVAAVWSCDPEVSLQYPAAYLFAFLQHHGMLAVFGSPPWRTVTGGSHEYVQRLAAGLVARGGEVRTGTKVTSIGETARGVLVTDGNGQTSEFDAVVIATHPAHALSMLAEPTPLQRELLGAMPYSPNTALLHTDTSVLPENRNAWASWNFRRPAPVAGRPDDGVRVTYDLTRLQRLPTETHYLVTLGGEGVVDPALVIDRMEYEHPLYTPESVAAQRRLPEISTDRIAFAGAYHGWGFHEDGARSGLAAAERLGLPWTEPDTEPGTAVPAQLNGSSSSQAPEAAVPAQSRGTSSADVTGVYDTTITHVRRRPFHRAFTHRSQTWVVDLDHLPAHGPARFALGTFEGRDHLAGRAGDGRTIRQNLETFLALEGVDLAGGRVLMAAQPRAWGYCFNPITVFWCDDAEGRPAATVVEVHNTYGDRHAYLVHPDEQGRARTGKQLYVSPFHGTDGHYELAVPRPTVAPASVENGTEAGAEPRLDVVVTLHTDDGARFTARLSGRRPTPGTSRRAALRAAPQSLRGSLLIRLHGVWLWLRRLPVRPRPVHHQGGVQ